MEETWNGKRLRPAIKEALKEVDRITSDEEYIKAANAQIALRTTYGVRVVEKPDYVARLFSWSNGYATWSPYQWVIDPANVEYWMLHLDANQIMLPALSLKRTVELVKQFDPLPLFANSFEYVHETELTCGCGLYVHISRRNPDAIHIPDCPYAKSIKATEIDMAPFQIVAPDDGIKRR